jgi:hypothetical protein
VELIDDLHRGLAGAPGYAAARLRGKFDSSAARVLAALAAPVEFADLLAVQLVRLNATALLDGGARGRSAAPPRPRAPEDLPWALRQLQTGRPVEELSLLG